MIGYFLAVTSSITVAVTMRKYLKPYTSKLSGAKLGIANCVSSCSATAIAGILNSLAMRNREIRHGIDIKDENNHVFGKSRACAIKANIETSSSRIVMALPMFGPPIIFFLLEKMRLLPKNVVLLTSLQCTIFLIELLVSAPLCVALFPQEGKINRDQVEKEF